MKILQLNFERGWRGGERQTLYCMRQFREAGHEVALMARRGSQMADTARSEGFQVYEQDGPAGQINFLLGSGRKFDILHAQTANTITWSAFTRWAHPPPVVFSHRPAFRAHTQPKPHF